MTSGQKPSAGSKEGVWGEHSLQNSAQEKQQATYLRVTNYSQSEQSSGCGVFMNCELGMVFTFLNGYILKG